MSRDHSTTPSRIIRASEIGEYYWCNRAWWLGRVKGVPNANRAALDAGIVRHRAHGETVARGDRAARLAQVFLLMALALGVLLAVGFALGLR